MYIAEHAEQTPDGPAVVMATTGETLTFALLEARANQFARLLRHRGLVPGDHIALVMENHVRFFELILGASRVGIYYTPISSHLTPSEVALVVNDSTSRVVVTTSKLLDVAQAAQSSCPAVEGWYTVGVTAPPSPFECYEDLVAAEVTLPLPDEKLGMAMMYSSGTTGRPKGVLRPLPDLAPRESTDAIRMGKGLMRFRPGMKLLSVAPL
jgi:acyl-CoA synthetase (AMP-forming)/AMP-acid ligase II